MELEREHRLFVDKFKAQIVVVAELLRAGQKADDAQLKRQVDILRSMGDYFFQYLKPSKSLNPETRRQAMEPILNALTVSHPQLSKQLEQIRGQDLLNLDLK